MDFELTEEQRLLRDSVDRLLADHYAFEKRRGLSRRSPRAGAGNFGRNMPSWGCWACRLPRNMAGSAAAASR